MNSLIAELSEKSYRLGLASFGAIAYLLATFFPTIHDPEVYDIILKNKGFHWKAVRPDYPWGFKVLLVAVPIFFVIYFAPQIVSMLLRRKVENSLVYGVIILILYSVISSISLFNFGPNTGFLTGFVAFGFIIATTEFIRGLRIDFSFAANLNISEQAKIRKIELLHKKWFSTLAFFLTVSVAVLVTGALRYFELWIQDYGPEAARIMSRALGVELVFAAIGLLLGPFNQMFKILSKVEDLLNKIQPEKNKA